MPRRVDEGQKIRDPLKALAAKADAGEDMRFYGRRKTKHLKPSQQKACDALLPSLKITLPKEGALEPGTLFPALPETAPIWLEIGFGGGEHLAGQAKTHPDVGFIGCEPFLNGIGSLCAHLREGGQHNVRILPDDARPLLTTLPEASLDKVFVLFPDPWPKTKHAKRRFISPRNLNLIGHLLKNNGELRVFTDDPTYQRWTLLHTCTHPLFTWQVSGPEDWRTPPADHIPTRYEGKALEEGRVPFYFRFKRVGRG